VGLRRRHPDFQHTFPMTIWFLRVHTIGHVQLNDRLRQPKKTRLFKSFDVSFEISLGPIARWVLAPSRNCDTILIQNFLTIK
jgi:hypothetical protein